jgi:diphthamide biosynthesis enzyme Dph1/Dph2-like protein
MKVLFIYTEIKKSFKIKDKELEKLPKNIFIVYSIQYKKSANNIKKKLKKQGKNIKGFRQVLGCTELNTQFPILLIGSGSFHALNLLLQDNEVYILEQEKIRKIPGKEIKKLKNKRKAALTKFLSAQKIGIIVSYKPGQENLSLSKLIKKKLENKCKDKKFRIFIADNINLQGLDNYNIDSWINTSCPSLTYDNKIISIRELKKFNLI